MAGKRQGRWRGAAIAGSVVVHGAVLALLAISVAPALRLPTARFEPDVMLDLRPLERRPSGAAAAPRQAARPDKPAPIPPSATAVAPRPAVLPPPPALRFPTSSPPAPTAATPTPAPTAAGPSPGPAAAPGDGRDWRVRPQGGDVHGLVREAIGCSHADYLKLTGAEQAACDRKFASLRGQDLPHVDSIPAEKRAYYDSVIQKREDQRWGAFKDLHEKQLARGIAGMKTHGVDINVGYHCTFKFGAGAKEANDAAGKKLGFPPCPIRLPGADPPPP